MPWGGATTVRQRICGRLAGQSFVVDVRSQLETDATQLMVLSMPRVVANRAVQTELSEAIRRCRTGFIGIGLFGALINLLMLTAPLFMLQVYDRVLPSHSVQTLVGLGILTVVLFSFQGLLDIIRARVLLRIGGSISEDLSARVYDALIRLPLKTGVRPGGLQPMRDLDQIRSFLSSAGPAAIFDLPWIPFYVGICFLFHPLIGLAALGGALILIALTLTAEFVTRKSATSAASLATSRGTLLEASRRNAEALQAMGMAAAIATPVRRHQ